MIPFVLDRSVNSFFFHPEIVAAGVLFFPEITDRRLIPLLFFVALAFCLFRRSLFSDSIPAINASNLALLASFFLPPFGADYAALSLRAIDNLVLLKRKIVSFDERNLRAAVERERIGSEGEGWGR